MEQRRPTVLTVLTVIAIVLGGLIVLSGLSQLFGLLFQEPLSQLGQLSMNQPGVQGEMIESQRDMQAAILGIQRGWSIFLWVFAPLSILFGVGLIVGGARALTMKPTGRRLLAYVCAFGVLFAIVREVGGIIMSIQIARGMEEHMVGMMPGSDAQADAVMSGIMGVSMAISVAFAGAWLLLKVVYYVWCLIYLTKERTRALYEGGAQG